MRRPLARPGGCDGVARDVDVSNACAAGVLGRVDGGGGNGHRWRG